MSELYGYVRVSSNYQNEERQVIALENFGVPAGNIFVDRQSGKNFNRPEYQRLVMKLRAEDVFVVKSIDRLGRNYAEILEQWTFLTATKRAAIVVLDMPILDTRRDRDILGTLIADIVLRVMSAFAQVEHDFIKQRQAEGIAAAKARGVKFGREPMPLPENFPEVCAAWKAGKLSARKAGKALGVTHITFLRWARADENK